MCVASRRVGFVRLGLDTLLHCVSADCMNVAQFVVLFWSLSTVSLCVCCRPAIAYNLLTGEQKVRQALNFGKIGEPLFCVILRIYNYHIKLQIIKLLVWVYNPHISIARNSIIFYCFVYVIILKKKYLHDKDGFLLIPFFITHHFNI
jgi:hypothetical protein